MREPTGRLRRRGQTVIVDWGEVTRAVAAIEDGQGAADLLATFEEHAPGRPGRTRCTTCRTKRRNEVAAALDDERLADVLEELPEDDQVEILARARRRPRRGRAGGDGPRRRRRPAGRAARRRAGASCSP